MVLRASVQIRRLELRGVLACVARKPRALNFSRLFAFVFGLSKMKAQLAGESQLQRITDENTTEGIAHASRCHLMIVSKSATLEDIK